MTRRRKHTEPGTFELLAKLPAQFIALAKAELNNAKLEITAKAKRLAIGVVAVVVALFFVFYAIGVLIASAVAGLAEVWPVWLAALVVGVALLLLAAAAIGGGFMLIKRGVPVPKDTLGRVEGDMEALGEVRFNASAEPDPDEAKEARW